MASEFATCT